MFRVPEAYRDTEVEKRLYKMTGDRGNGVCIRKGPSGLRMMFIASNGMGWEHVSVSLLFPSNSTEKRCPTWEEMCFARDMFWDEEDAVMQLHVPKSMHVNFHENCLHLWRPAPEAILAGHRIPIPHPLMVGPQEGKGVPTVWHPKVGWWVRFLSMMISKLKGGR